jgi:hypothetical protein
MCFQRQESERRTFAAGSSSWPTPRTITGGAESAERKQELGRSESGGGDLQSAAQKWPTPAARDYKGTNTNPEVQRDQLPNFVRHRFSEAAEQKWATPTASDAIRQATREGSAAHAGVNLDEMIHMISTGDSHGRLDPATPKDGETTSQRAVLNPRFVEALMGLPLGWSSAAIVSDASVMESFRLWLLAHSSPWRED